MSWLSYIIKEWTKPYGVNQISDLTFPCFLGIDQGNDLTFERGHPLVMDFVKKNFIFDRTASDDLRRIVYYRTESLVSPENSTDSSPYHLQQSAPL